MEAGHMTIETEGRPCLCGNRGCFERYASASALVEYVEARLKKEKKTAPLRKAHDEGTLTAKVIYGEAKKGDELALAAFKEIGTYLGIGIANLINLFNPEAVILGGGLSKAHDLLIPEIREVVKERALQGCKEGVKYLPIKDQSRIPALGAARMAMDALNS